MGSVRQAHHRDARERRRLTTSACSSIPISRPYDLSTSHEWVRAKLPRLPDQRRPASPPISSSLPYDARHLVEHRATADFFDECMALAKSRGGRQQVCQTVANLIINDVAAWLNIPRGHAARRHAADGGPGAFSL